MSFSSATTGSEVADAFAADCKGKVAIVTGANTGLGFETVRVLASKGVSLVLACRNPSKLFFPSLCPL
jgi:NAD(P)-dependent dehydrogenase (short-subunit alcohol dehydrogenase family)